MEQFYVRIADDALVFSAAHFITIEGGQCERLHGHNYRVAAEACGPLGEQHYVVDFHALRRSLLAILAELDHRMLLPAKHPTIHLVADEQEIEVLCADRRWAFPADDCCVLPIASTTAELLAQHIGQRLLATYRGGKSEKLARLRVEVEESFGCWAVWESTPE